MKTPEEIRKVLDSIDSSGRSKYSGMTYENGIEEALQWALEEIPDDEFAPICDV
jgi:hypothetical protein